MALLVVGTSVPPYPQILQPRMFVSCQLLYSVEPNVVIDTSLQDHTFRCLLLGLCRRKHLYMADLSIGCLTPSTGTQFFDDHVARSTKPKRPHGACRNIKFSRFPVQTNSYSAFLFYLEKPAIPNRLGHNPIRPTVFLSREKNNALRAD